MSSRLSSVPGHQVADTNPKLVNFVPPVLTTGLSFAASLQLVEARRGMPFSQLAGCGDPWAVVQPPAPPARRDCRDCLHTYQRTRYFSTSWVRRVSPLPGELVSGVREPP